MIRVTELNLYPVKSMRGFSPPRAFLHRWGFAGDRRWMLVTPAGLFLTQREHPALATLAPALTPHGIRLSAPGLGEIEALADGPAIQVTIWQDMVAAETCAPAVDAFVTSALGVPCRLVHLGDPARRKLKAKYREGDETVAFADGFPVLLGAASSLADLNARLPAPVRMNRFRPNIVIEGAEAWAEDCWRVVRIGGVRFRVAKPCDRCVTTTVEQETGARPDKSEPLRTLATFRRTPQGVMFGQNLVPLNEGWLENGATLEIEAAGVSNLMDA
jgi:uncharacterized protein YcbX